MASYRAALASMALVSCGLGSGERLALPAFDDGGLLKGSSPVPGAALAALSGLHAIGDGGELLGDHVAVRVRGDTVSLFAKPDASYAVLKAGCLDDGARLVLEGYFRRATANERGRMRLFVEPASAAAALCKGEAVEGPFGLVGLSDKGSSSALDRAIATTFERPPRDPESRFFVVAHRGGCRTSDQCGASENSLEVMRMAESLGADAIEIDVQLTSDGVPIVYHDEAFDPRLTSGAYCRGPVSSFTMAHVQALCRLSGGERVPSLDEALTAVIDDTTLRGVWLDIKRPSSLSPAAELAAKHAARARAAGRSLNIALGLPSTELIDAYRDLPRPPDGVTCLVELEASDVIDAGCGVWGVRWTRGVLAPDVERVRAHGARVAYWTLDEQDFIDAFLASGPDGLLTNRPGLVRQRHEMIGIVPARPR